MGVRLLRAAQSLCSLTGQSPRLLNAYVRVRLSPEARAPWLVRVAVIPPGSQPGERRFESGTSYQDWMPPSSMGKIGDFHFPEPGSNPGGGAARWCNRKYAGLITRVMAVRIRSAQLRSAIRCSSMAEQRAVNPSMLVRDQPPELWRLSSIWSEHRTVDPKVTGSSPVDVARPA
jgi:hypothetical protein